MASEEEEEEDYDDEDFEEEEFPDDFEEEADSASECSGDPSEAEAQRELEDSEGAHSQSVDPAPNGDLVDAEGSQEYVDSENAEEQAVGDPSEEEAQRELEDSVGAHSQSADPATNGDLVDGEESQEYVDSENAEEQAVGDPSEEEAQELEDSEGAHSQSVDPATNGDLADAEGSQKYADSENAEGQAVGDLPEDRREDEEPEHETSDSPQGQAADAASMTGDDQEVPQEPEDNEIEHGEAADGDTMIGVLPEDVEQEQEVTQEHGDIDMHAEEVRAATISGDLPAEANREEPEQHVGDKETACGPGDAPEEAIQQELHEQAGAQTMSGELADAEHDQVVQQSAPEAVNTATSGEGHLQAEEQQNAGGALETSHTSAPELLHSLLMESSLGSRHWSQLPEGHVAVGRHREIRVATAPSKLRRRSPGREGPSDGKGRPARAKREAFSIVKLEQPEQRSPSWVKAPEEPWSRRAPQRIKQAYCGSLVMLPKLKKPPPAETAEPGPANAQSSVRKSAAPRASPGMEREPFEPRQLQDFLSSASADIWRYYFPEPKPSGDVAIGAG